MCIRDRLGPEPIADEALNPMEIDEAQLDAIAANPLPCIDASVAPRMHEAILRAKSELDSLGAVIECVAYNVPAGLGDPMFDGMENLSLIHISGHSGAHTGA